MEGLANAHKAGFRYPDVPPQNIAEAYMKMAEERSRL